MPRPARLMLHLLGPLHATLDGQPLTLKYDKLRALLVYLACERRAHPRAALIGLLWADMPEAGARHNLSQALFNLRQALGGGVAEPPFILAKRDAVQLNPAADVGTDLADFEQILDGPATRDALQRASTLYRGEFLAHITVNDSAPFEEWLAVQRERLHRDMVEALSGLATLHEHAGDIKAAQAAAQRLLTLEPWHEGGHRLLMRTLWHSGDRAGAIKQFEACSRVLHDELGVGPGSETLTLAAHIRDSGGENRGSGDVLSNAPSALADPASSQNSAAGTALPAASTPFIGRERELQELVRLLTDRAVRLITLVAPGGMGKTRLAVEAAAAARPGFADGVHFVALSAVRTRAQLVASIAVAAGLSGEQVDAGSDTLIQALQSRHMLLLLDNFEQLLEDASAVELVRQLLAQTQSLKLLVTSREALALTGEALYDVRGLGDDAAGLFAQCARRARADFRLDANNQRIVAHICSLVDGMPLGIELAAAWLRTLSLAEIAREIAQDIDFLQASARDVPERQRSIRAVLDHTWARLSEVERHVLTRLSVFRGGFTREMARRAAGASLSVLAQLVARAIVRRAAHSRYELHELMRQFAEAYIQDAPAARRAHALAVLEQVEPLRRSLQSAEVAHAQAQLASEADNLRAAFDWSSGAGGDGAGPVHPRDTALALRLAVAGAHLWYVLPDWPEAKRQLRLALAHAGPGSELLTALARHHLAMVLRSQAAYAEATALFEQAIAALRATGERWQLAWVLREHALCLMLQHRLAEAESLIAESGQIFRALDDCWGIAETTFMTADLHWARGELEDAERLALDAVRIFREMNVSHGLGMALHTLGDVYLYRGQHALAWQQFETSLTLSRRNNNLSGEAWDRQRLGETALVGGDATLARQELVRALALRHRIGDHEGVRAALEALACALHALEHPLAARVFALAETRRHDAPLVLVQPLHASYAAGLSSARSRPADWAAGQATEVGQQLTDLRG